MQKLVINAYTREPKKHFVCPRGSCSNQEGFRLTSSVKNSICAWTEIYVNYYENENEDVEEVVRRNEKFMITDYL